MSRNSVKKALLELEELNLLNEVEEGIFGINIKFMSETIDKAAYSSMIDMKVALFDKDVEIQELRKEITRLKVEIIALKKSNSDMKSIFNNSKKTINVKFL